MRNLLTGAIASLGLAALIVGSASAADSYFSNTAQQASGNAALQGQLQRDMSGHSALDESPLGQIIVRGGSMPTTTDRAEQGVFAPGSSPWLAQSPDGQLIPTTHGSAMHEDRG